MKKYKNLMILLLSGWILTGCVTPTPPPPLKYSQWTNVSPQLETAEAHQKWLLFPVDIRVSEIATGGMVEEVPEWSEQATAHIVSSIRNYFKENGSIEIMSVPELNQTEQEIVDEHLALYEVVSSTAVRYSRSSEPAWAHKALNFDYTLGDGLRRFCERYGVRTGLIVSGSDSVSTTGRKVLGAAGILLGVGIPMGHSYLSVGVIDLENGNIVWFDYCFLYASHDMRTQADADYMVRDILKGLPEFINGSDSHEE